MHRNLRALTIAVLAGLTIALTASDARDGFEPLTIAVAFISASAFALGAWCAPPSLLFKPRVPDWTAGQRRAKASQLIGGALVATVAAFVLTMDISVVTIFGIAAAIALGAVKPGEPERSA